MMDEVGEPPPQLCIEEETPAAALSSVDDFRSKLLGAGALGNALIAYFEAGGLLADDAGLTDVFAEVRTRAQLVELIKDNMSLSAHRSFAISNLVGVLLRRCRGYFKNMQESEDLPETSMPQLVKRPSASRKRHRSSPPGACGSSGHQQTTPLHKAPKMTSTPTFTGDGADPDSTPRFHRQSTLRRDSSSAHDHPTTTSKQPPAFLGSQSPIVSTDHDIDVCGESDDQEDDSDIEVEARPTRTDSSSTYGGWGTPTVIGDRDKEPPSKEQVKAWWQNCRSTLASAVKRNEEMVSLKLRTGKDMKAMRKQLVGSFAKSSVAQQADLSRVMVPEPAVLVPKAARLLINKKYYMRTNKIRTVVTEWRAKPWVIVNGFKMTTGQKVFVYPSGYRAGYYDFVLRVDKISGDTPVVYGTVMGRGFFDQGKSYTDPVFAFHHKYSAFRTNSTDLCVSTAHCFEFDSTIESVVEGIRTARGPKRGHRLYCEPTGKELDLFFNSRPSKFTAFSNYMALPFQQSSEEAIRNNNGVAEPPVEECDDQPMQPMSDALLQTIKASRDQVAELIRLERGGDDGEEDEALDSPPKLSLAAVANVVGQDSSDDDDVLANLVVESQERPKNTTTGACFSPRLHHQRTLLRHPKR